MALAANPSEMKDSKKKTRTIAALALFVYPVSYVYTKLQIPKSVNDAAPDRAYIAYPLEGAEIPVTQKPTTSKELRDRNHFSNISSHAAASPVAIAANRIFCIPYHQAPLKC